MEVVKKPRSWLTIWIHLDSEIVVRHIKDATKEVFSERVKEIFVIDSMPGYIFLRVIDSDLEFCDFLRGIFGVGGILKNSKKNPLEEIKSQTAILFADKKVFSEGDYIEVIVGSLSGKKGRVTCSGESVGVELDVFGKMISFYLQPEEIHLREDKCDSTE